MTINFKIPYNLNLYKLGVLGFWGWRCGSVFGFEEGS